MIKAAKIFIIIGMIFCCWTILPIIFGAIALKKIKNNEMTTGWKIITLLFVNVIAGILLLCVHDKAPATAE